jgi:hypothetical protein
MILYMLNAAGEPIPASDALEWGLSFKSAARHVADERIGPYRISTVFLGIDHNFMREGPPVLWETMVFGVGYRDIALLRCSGAREQAEAMHQRMVKHVRRHLRHSDWIHHPRRKRRRHLARQLGRKSYAGR